MGKARISFHDFTSCEGCQLQVLNCEDELLGILGAVDIVQFREAIDQREWECDIAFIEGSFSRESDRARFEKIRAGAKIVVALGACACIGGFNAIKNFRGVEESMKVVYGDAASWYETTMVRAVKDIIKVDFELPGCPINKFEFLSFVKAVLAGRSWKLPDYPVCVECKLRENVCLWHKGQPCMGVVARAGCNAWCPSYGGKCYACRGLISDPNNQAAKDVMQEFGLSMEQVMREYRLCCGTMEVSEPPKQA